MKYHSPFSIFKSLGISPDEIVPEKLKQIEKRMLLELELSEEITLKAGDAELTRNDILNLFADLSEDDELYFHQLINQNPALERFLTDGTLNLKEKLYDDEILYSPEIENFREFISPYLVEVLKKELNIYFNKRDWRKAFRLLSLTDLLTDYYQSAAFDKLAGSLSQLITRIGDFARGDIPFDKKNHLFLAHDHFISFMNELPAEFDNYREKLAINLNNLGAQYQKSELNFVKNIFMSLRELKCSESMKRTIVANGNILTNNADQSAQEEKSESSGGYGCLSFSGILVLFFILIRACSLISSDSSSNRSYNRGYENSSIYLEQIRETLNKQNPVNDAKSNHKQFTEKIINTINYNRDSTGEDNEGKVVPLKPYYAYYKPFTDRTEGGDSIFIKNESSYDVVVFGLARDNKGYSIGIPAGRERFILVDHLEQLNLYIGRSWNSKNTILRYKNEPQVYYALYNGTFDEVGNFTELQLYKYYLYSAPDGRRVNDRAKAPITLDSTRAYVFEEVEIVGDKELPDDAGAVTEPATASANYPTLLLMDDENDVIAVHLSKELTVAMNY